MKRFLVATILLLVVFSSFSQQSSLRAVSAYGEFLFVSGIKVYTVNYDSRFAQRDDDFGYHLGVGLTKDDNKNVVVVPVGINLLLGNVAPHYFEGAAGIVIITAHGTGAAIAFMPSLGYRYQPLSNGLTFRFVFGAWISGEEVLLAPGISVGYKF